MNLLINIELPVVDLVCEAVGFCLEDELSVVSALPTEALKWL
jgi:hypothetical protein